MKFKPYKATYRIAPGFYKRWISSYLKYADFSIAEEKYAGFSVIYGLVSGFAIATVLFILNFSIIFVVSSFFAGFLLIQAFFCSVLILVSERRKKATEEVLPDALQLMAANIRSGLTPDRALMLSARPEFGPLEVEIRRAAKKTISGKSLEESLRGISERINSKILDRSMKLVIEGIRKGGELGSLLEQTADDIRHIRILLKEVSAYVLMYVIFIFFAAALAAPALFAVSTYLVQTMTMLGGIFPGEVPTPRQVGSLRITRVQIPAEFLMNYSLVALTITSIFGGLIIGLVREGTEKAGIKFIPLLFLLSFGIYFAVKTFVASMFAIPL